MDGRLRGVSILLVEDEADLRELLAETLAHHGADVRTASNAEEALQLLEQGGLDALVADIGLPGIDGLELVRLVRKRGDELPAVALTGYARPSDRAQVLSAGFQEHVTKPVDGARLVSAISGVLTR
jgi:hypothetical protein